MKVWLGLVAIFVPGGSVIALGLWLRRRWLARARAQVDAAIAEQAEKLYYTFTRADEQLETRARVRRDIADSIRRKSSAVASGSTSGSLLKMVKRP